MITPAQDKIAIKAILDTDSYIQRAGFLAENINTSKYGTSDLNNQNDAFQIFIYLGTPERANTPNQKGVVYNISIIGKRARQSTVDSVMEQVIALLSDADIGRGHTLIFLDAPIELASDAAIYAVETAFICYETIYNKIKT